MATKGNNGNLYNYNPITNVMPINSTNSWIYYKYTITNQNITHDISQDLNKLYLDSTNNADIFILYAGGGCIGGNGSETTPISSSDSSLLSSYFANFGLDPTIYKYIGYVNSGGGGGTGEVNITKIKLNDILDKKLNMNIGSTNDTTITYTQSSDNTTKTIRAYSNINSVVGINSGNNAIFNKGDRPINSNTIPAYNSTDTLYCGSASGYPGQQAIKYSQRTDRTDTSTYNEFIAFTSNGIPGTLAICNDFNSFDSTTNSPAYLKNVTLTDINDINSGKYYLGSYDVTQSYVNFSNQQLITDGTGVSSVLTGGYGSTYLKQSTPIVASYNGTTYNTFVDSFISQNGQNGPPGFVMIFYKTIPTKKVYYTNMYQTNYNPFNNLLPKDNYNYFMYSKNITTDIIHTIVNDNVSNNSIVADSNGNKVINILYVANGGIGGKSSTSLLYGGGGGGGGGEVLLTNLTIDLTTNNTITLNAGSSKGTSISNIYTYDSNNIKVLTTLTANLGISGSDAVDKNGVNGANSTTVSTFLNNNISTTSYNKTVSYGSGTGGGGIGYLYSTTSGTTSGTNGIRGTGLNVIYKDKSSKTAGYIKINDIGDGTGPINVSTGGMGGSSKTKGSDGADGFVLIYYLVKGQM